MHVFSKSIVEQPCTGLSKVSCLMLDKVLSDNRIFLLRVALSKPCDRGILNPKKKQNDVSHAKSTAIRPSWHRTGED